MTLIVDVPENDPPSLREEAAFREESFNRKRSREFIVQSDNEDSTAGSEHTEPEDRPRNKRQRLSHVVIPDLLYPESLYTGHRPQEELTAEREAVRDLLTHVAPDDEQYITLSDFCVYRPLTAQFHPGVLCPLNELLTRRGTNNLCFDGIAIVGNKQHYLERVPFEVVSVEGYEQENVTVRNGIYLQSRHLQNSEVWYKLARPAKEYARFHHSYLWLADFCKHFVSFLLAHDRVTLHDFKSRFNTWLHGLHGRDNTFKAWQSLYNQKDFRTVVAGHYEYLWKESTSLGGHDAHKIRRQFLWREIDNEQLSAIPEQPYSPDAKTLVTPYVYNLFRHMYFGDQLITTDVDDHIELMNGSANAPPPASAGSLIVGPVRIGDVVCLDRDEDGHWRDQESTWYAYVHDVECTKDGQEQLYVFWLYRPSETTCGTMQYPFKNELFFSDHCNCNCEKVARIFTSDVKGKLSVKLFATTPEAEAASIYFVRQTYITDEHVNHFVTMNKSHLRCEHRTKRPSIPPPHMRYAAGDTVLIRQQSDVLEPASIVTFKEDGKYVEVRAFLRKERDLDIADAAPNELAYTQRTVTIPSSYIKRACHIRVYSVEDVKRRQVPMPYNLHGVGDYWIVTSELMPDGSLGPPKSPASFKEGHNPREYSVEQLPILDLFCGSGSFGRGIGVGGAGKVKWAVDIDKYAIHTKRANLDHDQEAALFWGSAVDYFARAAAGRFSPLIATLAAVGMIIAGSPCQGFSLLQEDAASARSRRNASMVALVVAFVDLYRPKYALLENVFGMTRKFGPNKDEDVFAQIVCALVGLGYQCRYFLVDAFSQGSTQNRTRIFISIAAPGLTPIECPPTTHRAPAEVYTKGIGRSLAGVSFGTRVFGPTPFPYVSTAAATKDLPSIGDGAVGVCIPFPDHRLSRTVSIHKRLLIRSIPRFPHKQGFITSLKRQCIPEACFGTFEKRVIAQNITHPKIWSRVDPNGIFDTVTTSAKPDDIRNGRWLHWDQHRMITIMEARRAQSFPDDTVLIGLPSQQLKLIGNAVSFNVATGLGVSLRRAMVKDSAVARRELALAPTYLSTPVIVMNKIAIRVQDYHSNGDVPLELAHTTVHVEEVVRIPAAETKEIIQPKYPSIVLLQERDELSDSDDGSEDPLTTAKTVLTPQHTDRMTGSSSVRSRTLNGLTPIEWPTPRTLSQAEFAQAAATGNHFARYMVVKG